jgi:esterase/lipase superfamily enzyme
MHREHHRWFSPSLGKDMDLLIFGHAGARVLVFPTSMGKFFEWQDRGMMGALGEHLERGWIQLYCVDSVDEESWYAKWKHPHDRAVRHAQWDSYLINEVVPLSWHKNQNPFFMTVGASFGAFHAMSFGLRYPHLVNRVIGLSGLYDIREISRGYTDDLVYHYNTPQVMPHEHDHSRLSAMRRMDIIMAIGRDDSFAEHNRWFSGVLWNKGIGNALRIWDGWSHDWPYWMQMIQVYIRGHD